MKKLILVLVLLMASCSINKINTEATGIFTDLKTAIKEKIVTEEPLLYMAVGNIFAKVLSVPHEVVALVFRRGDFILFTNRLKDNVVIPDFFDHIKGQGKDIKDCILIIHNHNTADKFSVVDIRFRREVRKRGFRGEFGIYYPFSKKVFLYGDKQ